ncbi:MULTISPECIES: rhodanese-like domain-containing protein [Methylomonas]|uniref:rhodanese-like domain-containing protein n=1 Tax=Methylomonas TaxID=416 RepID=UPI0012323FDB|nr:rhodanese-like domain-containing protein [Methylomonas rhizoryzae]
MRNYLISLCWLAAVNTGCNFVQPDYVQMLSPAELKQVLQQQDVVLIDVHVPEQKHIAGTDLVIPFNRVEEYQGKLPADKDTPIYLYCEGGPMGNAAARVLHDLGYKRLYNLDGGTKAWRQAGFGLE